VGGRRGRPEVRDDHRRLPTVSLDDLIASKQTGRPQDVADLVVLEEIRRLR